MKHERESGRIKKRNGEECEWVWLVVDGYDWEQIAKYLTSVKPFWNRLTKCNHILKEKVKKIVMVKFFFLNSTSARTKSNLAKGGGLLAQINRCYI